MLSGANATLAASLIIELIHHTGNLNYTRSRGYSILTPSLENAERDELYVAVLGKGLDLFIDGRTQDETVADILKELISWGVSSVKTYNMHRRESSDSNHKSPDLPRCLSVCAERLTEAIGSQMDHAKYSHSSGGDENESKGRKSSKTPDLGISILFSAKELK